MIKKITIWTPGEKNIYEVGKCIYFSGEEKVIERITHSYETYHSICIIAEGEIVKEFLGNLTMEFNY